MTRPPGVTLIDGRSGSGKTSLAEDLARELLAAGQRSQTLHLEDLYPGWDGLAAGSLAVAAALDAGEYRAYDWVAGEFLEASVALDPAAPLIIEGCGAITAANLAAAKRWGGAVHSIWVDCPDDLRRSRALARDGEMFAPHWERWAAQEDVHFALHRPWLLADKIVDASTEL